MQVTNLKKHYGAYRDAQATKLVVAFRKVPNDEEFCLVVELGSIPDHYAQVIEQALGSKDARETNEFSSVLNTRTFSDGTNCLQRLHHAGYLKKVKVTDVVMEPMSNNFVDLATINAAIDNTLGQSEVADIKTKITSNDPESVANALLVEAKTLEAEALKKREDAYALVPSLRPSAGRPTSDEARKAETAAARKERRNARERDLAEANKAVLQDAILERAAIAHYEGTVEAKS